MPDKPDVEAKLNTDGDSVCYSVDDHNELIRYIIRLENDGASRGGIR